MAASQEIWTTTLINDANLQSYYRLEDVSDSKGSNTLTNNNSVSFSTAQFGSGANLGAANSNKFLSTSATMSIDGNSCTFSFWFKALAEIGSGTWTLIDQVNNTSQVELFVKYDFNGGTRRLIFGRNKIGGTEQDVNFNFTAGTANFNHIVFVYDGVNVQGYVNGSATTSTAASGNGVSTSTAGISIGASTTGSGGFASVLVDDCAIFNRALTPTEVSNIYNGGLVSRFGAGILALI